MEKIVQTSKVSNLKLIMYRYTIFIIFGVQLNVRHEKKDFTLLENAYFGTKNHKVSRNLDLDPHCRWLAALTTSALSGLRILFPLEKPWICPMWHNINLKPNNELKVHTNAIISLLKSHIKIGRRVYQHWIWFMWKFYWAAKVLLYKRNYTMDSGWWNGKEKTSGMTSTWKVYCLILSQSHFISIKVTKWHHKPTQDSRSKLAHKGGIPPCFMHH